MILTAENLPFLIDLLQGIKKFFWAGSLGYKYLLNFTWNTMKFHNRLHANVYYFLLLITKIKKSCIFTLQSVSTFFFNFQDDRFRISNCGRENSINFLRPNKHSQRFLISFKTFFDWWSLQVFRKIAFLPSKLTRITRKAKFLTVPCQEF